MTRHVIAIISVYYAASLLTYISILIGIDLPAHWRASDPEYSSFSAAVTRFDGGHYRAIATLGYSYDESKRSDVAFFPAYPLAAWALSAMTSLNTAWSMVIISNVSFLIASLILFRLGLPFHQSTSVERETQTFLTQRIALFTVLLFILNPASLFFRVAYSESLFCLVITGTLLACRLNMSILVIASLAGLASAIRPVGIAVSAMVCWYWLSLEKRTVTKSLALKFVFIGLLSSWGLLAYSAYLWWAFDSPLAFAKTQEYWTFFSPKGYTFLEKVGSLLTLEPIWNVYNPGSQRYWLRTDIQDNLFCSLLFWNPIFYLFTWFLTLLGWWKRWLKGYEIVLSLGLLLIPYVTRAYEMSMASHARFAAVVIPQYFVLSRLFAMMPPAIAGCLCGLMGLLLGLWTALFVAGYRFF